MACAYHKELGVFDPSGVKRPLISGEPCRLEATRVGDVHKRALTQDSVRSVIDWETIAHESIGVFLLANMYICM